MSGADFREWARLALAPPDDLAALGKAVGDASIIALTEGTHGAAEPLEFRNRALRYLVETRGVTAIAIESGIVESQVVHDYVRGGPGDLSTVLAQGISWTMDQLPQNRELIRWLRDYNSTVSPERQVNFYGFDVSGSPGNVGARRGMDTALRATLEYLDQVDPSVGASFHARLDALIPYIRFDLSSAGYEKLGAPERDRLTAAIADLVSLLQRCETRFSEWAMRSALGARDVDAWLRCVPIDWQPLREPFSGFPNEQIRFLSACHDVRDRAQADCVDWIIEREAGRGRLLLFAHRYHLSCTTVDANGWFSREPGTIQQQPAGTYIKRRHGKKVVTVGNFIGEGSVHCADLRATLPRAVPESLDGFFAGLGSEAFLLDLRDAPDSMRQWLDQQQVLGQDPIRLRLRSAYDLVLFFARVSPAGS